MTCPKCHVEFEKAVRKCPECGLRLMHKVSGMVKTSAVMIASGKEQGFYTSVEEVPQPLRSRLIECTTNSNSGTIVIADRAGRERLSRILARHEAQAQLTQASAEPGDSEQQPLRAMRRMRWLAWAGLVMVLVLAAITFALFESH